MGVSLEYATAADLREALDFAAVEFACDRGHSLLLPDIAKKLLDACPVKIRSGAGVKENHFYIDVENGELVITPASYYKTRGRGSTADPPAS